MSVNQSLSKSQRKRLNRANKRKASKSPELNTDINSSTDECSTDFTGIRETSCAFQPNGLNNQSESEHFVRSVLSFNTSPIMNFGQQIPFNFQTPQANQTPNVFSRTPLLPSTTTTPSLAITLLEDVRMIKDALPKIDKIEQSMKEMNSTITGINNNISTLETKVQDMEQAVLFINTSYETHKKRSENHER